MKILKFGGTSVANAGNILLAENIIRKESVKNKIVVVVSALHGVTDGLLEAAILASQKNESYNQVIKSLEEKHLHLIRELIPVLEQSSWLSFVKKQFNDLEDLCNSLFILGELTDKIRDRIVSYGEFLSSHIIVARLQSEGLDSVWMDTGDLILTDSSFTNAKVNPDITEKNIRNYLSLHQNQIIIAPGFIARDQNGNRTTLGRGGSDYTASIIAASVCAEELQIWTDVNGMMTADPRIAPNAQPILQISYHEAMELSHFGAKVLYPPSIQPVMAKNINLKIKNTFDPENQGTRVSDHPQNSENNRQAASGISSMKGIALLTLEGSGMAGIPGIAAKFFQCLSLEKINILLITQGSSKHSITIAVDEKEASRAEQVVNHFFADDIKLERIAPLKVESSLSIVALVGENMKNKSGVSSRMFGCLGNNGINISAIAQGSSERNISIVIAEKNVQKAVNILHEEFFESEIKQIHLYICGTGNVGSKLIQQIYEQNRYLRENLLINLRIAGISNSRQMLFSDRGISENEYMNWGEKASKASVQGFAEEIISRNLRNAVFVDVTASSEVPVIYEKLLRRSISIVACNKIAASSDFEQYKNLKDTARNHSCHFHFETNVGAGLPVIGTISDLIRSGDKITSIKAVLSGTLNFVFNHYDGSRPFSEIVAQAQKEGYTEPDPRLDLAGTDVARKILILAREAGYSLQFEDIENNGFLPEECLKGNVEDFYRELTVYEDHFKNILEQARHEGKILKYTAEFKDGKALVGLRHVAPESDLYHLYGKDNIVIFETLRYSEQPLVIKGAGAGAEVTASGVFADIMRSV